MALTRAFDVLRVREREGGHVRLKENRKNRESDVLGLVDVRRKERS